MISKITIKKAFLRFLQFGAAGAIGFLALVPVNFDDPNKYFMALGVALIAGFLGGLAKAIKGYIKYDNVKK